jgi:CheY-like chemotaxis protein
MITDPLKKIATKAKDAIWSSIPQTQKTLKDAITEEWKLKAQSKRILIVDDDRMSIDLFATLTRDWDYDLVPALSVVEAVEKIQPPNEYVLALLDVVLINGSGLDLYRCIVSDSPAMNVAFLTGYLEETIQPQVSEIGPARVFNKTKLGDPLFISQLMLQVSISKRLLVHP